MIVPFFVHWVLLAGEVALITWLLPGISVIGGVVSVLAVALFIGIVNALLLFLAAHLSHLRSVARLTVLALLVNTMLLWAVASLTNLVTLSGLPAAAPAAVLISGSSTVLAVVTARLRDTRRRRSARSSAPDPVGAAADGSGTAP